MLKEERQGVDEKLDARLKANKDSWTDQMNDMKAQQSILSSQISQVERESKLLPAQLKFEIPQLVQ